MCESASARFCEARDPMTCDALMYHRTMPVPYLLNYVLHGLDASPNTLATILKGLDEKSPLWEVRPGPERFTLRESVAHLADWEPIWVQRMTRIVSEDTPSLPSIDEGEMAVLHDYAHASPTESLRKYKEERKKVVAFLRERKETDWARQGNREGAGLMSLFEIAAMILGHDGYHMTHALECLK